ncbi:MAG: hypothetical protein NC489_21385 [Ruminococcus flavefaciens]|nr:hypothetical protein [Ruminococcus flavefaciens]
MILEEFMKSTVPSDRLIIEDSTGELYRGFVGGLQYNTAIDRSREVIRHGLSTDIFRKENRKMGAASYTTAGEEIPVERISEFAFSDLMMKIYTKVTLEG